MGIEIQSAIEKHSEIENKRMIKDKIFKLIAAHRNYAATQEEFEKDTGLEVCLIGGYIQLYGEKSYTWIMRHNGMERRENVETMEASVKIDGMKILCLKNL